MAIGCDSQLQDVQVDMRDGVKLLTDIYMPEGAGPFPVILSRVPYGTKLQNKISITRTNIRRDSCYL
jgi:predicted acyl esterase